MPRYTKEQKAQAVARVVAGEHRRAVARDLGVSDATVRRWLAGAERRATAQEKAFGELADDIADRIRGRQEELREALLRRMAELIPAADDLKVVATAYGIVTDKALLAAGKPTRIHGGALGVPPDATPEELVSIADELRRRREAHPARRLR